MCQTIAVIYSCGCAQDPVSIPCERPTNRCIRFTQAYDVQKLEKPCPDHRSRSRQDNPTRRPPGQDAEKKKYPPQAYRGSHQRTTLEHFETRAIPTQPASGPYRVDLPESRGLRALEHNSTIAHQNLSGSQSLSTPKRSMSSSGKSHPLEAPVFPPRQSSRSQVIARKPLPTKVVDPVIAHMPIPINVMDIPVYDNGTNASHQAAQKLKSAMKPTRNTHGRSSNSSSSRTLTPRHEPPARPDSQALPYADFSQFATPSSSSSSARASSRSSQPSTHTSQSSSSSRPLYRPRSVSNYYDDPSLWPAPLKIVKKPVLTTDGTDTGTSRGISRSHFRNTRDYRNRSLPPSPVESDQMRGLTQRLWGTSLRN